MDSIERMSVYDLASYIRDHDHARQGDVKWVTQFAPREERDPARGQPVPNTATVGDVRRMLWIVDQIRRETTPAA